MANTTATDPRTDDAVSTPAAEPPSSPPNWFTRRRLAKWDGPRRPRDWRFVVGTVGKVLIATGILLFGFVAYQLWGTGLETARAQRSLEAQFEQLLAGVDTVPTTTVPVTAPPTVPDEPDVPVTVAPEPEPAPTTEPAPVEPAPPVREGDPLARIEIPRIGVSDIVVAGVGVRDLQKGPGHFPDTPLPGQLGNAAIAGHRTTYGQPFRNVDRLEPGDEIIVTTLAGRFVYRVTATQIVSPSDYQVVATTRPDVAEITLVSCHPVWSAAQRIIVSGELDLAASPPPGERTSYRDAPEPDAPPPTLPGDDLSEVTVPDTTAVDPAPEATAPQTSVPEAGAPDDTVAPPPVDEPAPGNPDDATDLPSTVEDAFGRGWFHDEGAFSQVALWGALLSLISIGAYLVSRRSKRDLVGFAVGIVPFCVAAFFFFQNVNRLLPPNL